MMHTNELGLLLSEMMNQMQQNMPGSGQCNKPGGKNKKPGSGLPQTAEQMKKQIEEIDANVKAKVKECEEFAENSPYPEKSLMYDAVYEQANYPFLKHKI